LASGLAMLKTVVALALVLVAVSASSGRGESSGEDVASAESNFAVIENENHNLLRLAREAKKDDNKKKKAKKSNGKRRRRAKRKNKDKAKKKSKGKRRRVRKRGNGKKDAKKKQGSKAKKRRQRRRNNKKEKNKKAKRKQRRRQRNKNNKGKNKTKKSRRKSKDKKQKQKKKQKSRKSGKKRPKKNKNKSKKRNTKKGGNRKKGNQAKKQKTPLWRNGRNTTDKCYTDLLAQTKKFQKFTNQYRKVLRIERYVELSKRKKDKAATSFEKPSMAMKNSTKEGASCSNATAKGEAKEVYDTLAKCKTTAAALCKVEMSTEEKASLDKCKPAYKKYTEAFQACLKSGECTCFQKLKLDNEADCDKDFSSVDTAIKGKKDKCVKSSEKGSFGACRAMERKAAYMGVECVSKCDSTMTTAAPSGRSMRREALFKNFKSRIN